jgi:hypothetical protein
VGETRGGISFLNPELSRWDGLGEARPELLVAPFFADERPLRGAAGLADWRLCGRLSRLLAAGRVGGAFGEATLLPGQKLAFPRVVLFGLGPSDGFDEPRFRAASRAIRELARGLGSTRYALPLPGRSTGRIMARRAVELWLEEGPASPEEGCLREEVWLIEEQAAQKDMSDALGKAARR